MTLNPAPSAPTPVTPAIPLVWRDLMAQAKPLSLTGGQGYVYFLADPHLDGGPGDQAFLDALARLEAPRMLVLLGDVFKVWMGLPRFWNPAIRRVMAALAELRQRGCQVVLVVGNRDFLVPEDPATLARLGLPFDAVVPGAAVLTWGPLRVGMTHGDLVNLDDRQYLRWRAISRSWGFGAAFHLMPGFLARAVARKAEAALSKTNRLVKIAYPAHRLQAFAQAACPGLRTLYLGHFHKDGRMAGPGGSALRMVPDWLLRRALVRLDAKGREETLAF